MKGSREWEGNDIFRMGNIEICANVHMKILVQELRHSVQTKKLSQESTKDGES